MKGEIEEGERCKKMKEEGGGTGEEELIFITHNFIKLIKINYAGVCNEYVNESVQ